MNAHFGNNSTGMAPVNKEQIRQSSDRKLQTMISVTSHGLIEFELREPLPPKRCSRTRAGELKVSA